MAVVVEYQAWDSASYNWLDKTTSTSAPVQINDKLDAWVAAVNANASNTNKQITVRKDPTDSTSANFIGWVVEAASSSSNSTFFTRFYSNSTSNCVCSFSPAWTNDGTNGGYGAAVNGIADTTISFTTSGVLAEFSVATETANGQEFFCLSWRLNNSTSLSDALLIFKDSNGEWASLLSDGGSVQGSYYMPTHTTPQRNYNVILNLVASNNSSGVLARLVLQNNGTSFLPAASNEYTAAVASASPSLYFTTTTLDYGYGRWASVSGGRKAVAMHYGQLWIVF